MESQYQKRKRNLSSDDRVRHSVMERERREVFKKDMVTLAGFLPSLMDTKEHLLSKRVVVAESIKQHVAQCATIRELRCELEKVKNENRVLSERLGRKEQQSERDDGPAPNNPFHHGVTRTTTLATGEAVDCVAIAPATDLHIFGSQTHGVDKPSQDHIPDADTYLGHLDGLNAEPCQHTTANSAVIQVTSGQQLVPEDSGIGSTAREICNTLHSARILDSSGGWDHSFAALDRNPWPIMLEDWEMNMAHFESDDTAMNPT